MADHQKTLKQTAFEQIKAKIVSGEWEGGTFLTEKSLSEWLQMSKTPIRSALDRLEMMGLVQIAHNQGAFVKEVSLNKILEIYELRLALETHAVRTLTGKLSSSLLSKLDENIAEQAEAVVKEDIIRYVELDREFHQQIVSALYNAEYSEMMSLMQDKFLLAVRTTFIKNKQRLWGSIEEHRKLREALDGHDPEETVTLMWRHIEYVKKIMI